MPRILPTAVLLPLDKGSILLPADPIPRNAPRLTTIHTNGHILQSRYEPERGFYHAERDQTEIGWMTMHSTRNWIRSVADLADKQAFGFRINGETENPLHITQKTIQTIELEPLNYGGVAISEGQNVPIGIYLKTGESYRIHTEDNRKAAILSYRQDNRSNWEEIKDVDITEIDYLASIIADRTKIECLMSPSTKEIEETIISEFETSHKRAQSPVEEHITDVAGINIQTAFNDTIPDPAPLFDK